MHHQLSTAHRRLNTISLPNAGRANFSEGHSPLEGTASKGNDDSVNFLVSKTSVDLFVSCFGDGVMRLLLVDLGEISELLKLAILCRRISYQVRVDVF